MRRGLLSPFPPPSFPPLPDSGEIREFCRAENRRIQVSRLVVNALLFLPLSSFHARHARKVSEYLFQTMRARRLRRKVLPPLSFCNRHSHRPVSGGFEPNGQLFLPPLLLLPRSPNAFRSSWQSATFTPPPLFSVVRCRSRRRHSAGRGCMGVLFSSPSVAKEISFEGSEH